jgi:tRNA pseudouridine38-40 synthase
MLSYDGTAYFGWQKTDVGPSIEQTLQQVLETILQQSIVLQAASRTDRGVHAHGQVVNFFSDKPILNFEKFHFQLNSMLPKDIRVLEVSKERGSFHPTIDVLEKTYVYTISASFFQLPIDRHYAWHVYYPLDLALMKEAASHLIGTHDFKGFTNRKIDEVYEHHVRTIHDISFVQNGDQIQISISGNHFLYKMIRNIVGTLVYIGCNKLPIHVINSLMTEKNRKLAGITAPAHGLSLFKLKYKE